MFRGMSAEECHSVLDVGLRPAPLCGCGRYTIFYLLTDPEGRSLEVRLPAMRAATGRSEALPVLKDIPTHQTLGWPDDKPLSPGR